MKKYINITRVVIDKPTIQDVTNVLKSGMIAHGEITLQFEKKLMKLYSCKYAISLTSGTAALHTALLGVGIRPGDEVITSPLTFIATTNAILLTGAKPVFIDIQENSFNIDPHLVEKNISSKTKAILAVDLYGFPADYLALGKIAQRYNLKLLIDSCQSIGSQIKMNAVFKTVDALCFSFYATKNIAMGEGGAILTDNPDLASFSRRFRHQGQDDSHPYIYHQSGTNYCPTDIQAAIGLGQLRHLISWTKKRRSNAAYYTKSLTGLSKYLIPPLISQYHVFHQYTLRVVKSPLISREELQRKLLAAGVKSAIYYPQILPSQPHVKKLTNFHPGDYPVAETAASQVLSLPVHPHLTRRELKYVVDTLKNIYAK